MTDSTVYTEISRAIPVIIGGLLAVGGGLIGQFVTHRLTAKREQAKARRERLESLVKALYAHSHWLEDKRNAMIFRNEDHDMPSPLDEACMLQALHFPELCGEVLAIQEAQLSLINFIGQQRIARMKDQSAWLQAWDNEPYLTAYRQYLLAVGLATKKCRELLLEQS